MFKKYKLTGDKTKGFTPIVNAFKIQHIEPADESTKYLIAHVTIGGDVQYETVDRQFVEIFEPEVGGYFIKDDDKNCDWCLSAGSFQQNYFPIGDDDEQTPVEEISGLTTLQEFRLKKILKAADAIYASNAEIEDDELTDEAIANAIDAFDNSSDEPQLESFSDFINNLSSEIHIDNIKAGWWNNPEQCLFEKLQLVNTEIAEGTEGLRKDLKDDKLPHRMMEEVELADAIIRLLDLGGYLGLDYDENATGDLKSFDDITSEAGQHFICTRAVIYLGTAIQFQDEPKVVNLCYSEAINYLLHVGKLRGYEVLAALQEKREFNKTRKDHTPEARAAENGKKF